MVKKSKTDVALLNSKELKGLVDESMTEVDNMLQIAENAGFESEDFKQTLRNVYLKNLKKTDEPVLIAKKLLAEGLTRIELQKMIKTEETDFVSKDFLRAVNLSKDLLKLVKDLEPKKITHNINTNDDKMIFDIKEGVYEENE